MNKNKCQSAWFIAKATNYLLLCLAFTWVFIHVLWRREFAGGPPVKPNQRGTSTTWPSGCASGQSDMEQPGSGSYIIAFAEMHWERGCWSELSDTAQQVAKQWFPAQVCCPSTQVSKGSRSARGFRVFCRGTARLHSRIFSSPLGANIISITAAFLKRGVREKGKNVREE